MMHPPLIAPPSREQWLHSLDARHPASRTRSLLWHSAVERKITYAELQHRIAELKQQHASDAENFHKNTVYDHEGLPAMPRHLSRRQMPTKAT
ncbi:hypothetical protein AC629_14460 [Bradyrhizobium sp. NAS80.1]|uniref:hypothetical protein n=1 Tax=Bradyrhizobium sp. NAS80.1 TaxID=1680159 RepID=UPI000961E6C3|nr:hypothetical protein [Bradyrhizobium sp. NAS80.1]OKO87288.1 hypothetical protein AC629_14460 [Bradyrhizobium sp. NAS80.1]